MDYGNGDKKKGFKPQDDSLIKTICEDRVYRGQSISLLSKRHRLEQGEIKRILEESKTLLDDLTREKENVYKWKYDSLTKLSYSAMKSILRTPHETPILDKNGLPIYEEKYWGPNRKTKKYLKKIDYKMLELKQKVAEQQLKSVGVIKPEKKGGGVNILQMNAPERKQVEKQKEVKALLDECITDAEVIEDN